MSELEWVVSNGVGTITVNRPSVRNAVTIPMIGEMARLLRGAGDDDSVRVVVLTGAGDKAFCSGLDLGSIPVGNSGVTPAQRKDLLHHEVQQVARAMESLDKPTIASINGVAVGAGLDLALACDLRVMARGARVSASYVKLGLVPGGGGAYYLPRIVGLSKALEILLTGDFVEAEDALGMGLVNRLADVGEIDSVTRMLAERIAEHPPLAVRMIKRAAYQSANTDLRTALDLISSHFAVVAATEDAAEALAAAKGRRTPQFTGR